MTAGVPLPPRGRLVRGGFVRGFFVARRGGSLDVHVTAAAVAAFIEDVEDYAARLADAALEEAQAAQTRDTQARRVVETKHIETAARRPREAA